MSNVNGVNMRDVQAQDRVQDCVWRKAGVVRSWHRSCYNPEGPKLCPYKGDVGWWECRLWEKDGNGK